MPHADLARAWAVAALVSCAAAPLAAQVFTRVADSAADGLDAFELGAPALNDAGQVAFRAADAGLARERVLRGSAAGGPLATLGDTSASGLARVGPNVSINLAGAVAFWAELDAAGDEAVYRADGAAAPVEIVRTSTSPLAFLTVVPSLNADGAVALQAELDDADEGLFVGAGGPLETIFDTGASPRFSASFAGPSLNDDGQIAFRARDEAGVEGVHRSNGGSFALLADTTGPAAAFDDEPTLNAAGTVAFEAALDAGTGGEEALYVAEFFGAAIERATSLDTPLAGFDGVALNDAGQLAYLAALDDGGQALLLDGQRVVGTGDALDGSTVAGLLFFREGLNDAGQLAFTAALADGRAGVFVATVPEPAAAAAVLATSALLVQRRRRGVRRSSRPTYVRPLSASLKTL